MPSGPVFLIGREGRTYNSSRCMRFQLGGQMQKLRGDDSWILWSDNVLFQTDLCFHTEFPCSRADSHVHLGKEWECVNSMACREEVCSIAMLLPRYGSSCIVPPRSRHAARSRPLLLGHLNLPKFSRETGIDAPFLITNPTNWPLPSQSPCQCLSEELPKCPSKSRDYHLAHRSSYVLDSRCRASR